MLLGGPGGDLAAKAAEAGEAEGLRDAVALARFIPDCIVLFKRLLGDQRVSGWRKAAIVLLIGYLAMPIDLVPDFIPVAGQLDDVLPGYRAHARRRPDLDLVAGHVLARHVALEVAGVFPPGTSTRVADLLRERLRHGRWGRG